MKRKWESGDGVEINLGKGGGREEWEQEGK